MTLTGKARLAGLVGWPVAHSRSPLIHNFWLQRYGIDGAYVPLAVDPTDLDTALRALPSLGFRGVNLTVPHKTAALECADEVSGIARAVGAANTLTVDENRRLIATNTDVFGLAESLRLSGLTEAPISTATILGAGGAARAAVAALAELGISTVRIANRTRARAEAIAGDLGAAFQGLRLEVVDWAARSEALCGAELLVNTTSLGMTGAPPLEIDLRPLPPTACVADIVYSTLETPLLAAARARGLVGVDGLGMLVHQARPGFQAWFGRDPLVTDELMLRLKSDLGV